MHIMNLSDNTVDVTVQGTHQNIYKCSKCCIPLHG